MFQKSLVAVAVSTATWATAFAAGPAPASTLPTMNPTPLIQMAAMDPVVISAALVEQKLSEVIPSVTVITRQDIDQSGALSLADLVRSEPGVEIGRNGGLGGLTSFFLRGAESRNVLILIDGVRMRDGVTQAALAEHIPLGLVERIEIVRGNVSALYGDAAVGGVISITTRQAGQGPMKGFASVTVGERATREVSAGLAGAVESLRMALSVQHLKTDGFSATNPSQTWSFDPTDGDRDPYENTAAALQLATKIGKTDLGGSLSSSKASLRYDNEWSGQDPQQDASNERVHLFVRHPVSERWNTRVDLSQNRIRLDYNFGVSNKTEVDQVRWDNRFTLSARQTVLVGLDRREERRSPAASGLSGREVDSAYLGFLNRSGPWTTQLNLRYDDASTGESKSTWLVGVGRQLSDFWRMTASASTAFRLPDAYALSTNASLKPEFHDSREIGLQGGEGDNSIRLVFFQAETDNPIVYDANYVARNQNFIENEGIEISGRWLATPWLRLKADLTLQDPNSPFEGSATATTRVQSARRAKVHGALSGLIRSGGNEFEMSVFGAGSRRDTDYDPVGLTRLPGYAVVALRAKFRLDPEWAFVARLENAGDKQYQLAYGYNTAPRTTFLGVQFQPK
jgi:vitamin B12 transporter